MPFYIYINDYIVCSLYCGNINNIRTVENKMKYLKNS